MEIISLDVDVVVNRDFGGFVISPKLKERINSLRERDNLAPMEDDDWQHLHIRRDDKYLVEAVKTYGAEINKDLRGTRLVVDTIRVRAGITSDDGWETVYS